MTRTFLSLAVLLILGSSTVAGNMFSNGDYYLISRDKQGVFVGGHKLFMRHSRGLRHVQYCRTAYFVRVTSVAWTQREARRGNIVRIELNVGHGWQPICFAPQSQVTLADLGIDIEPELYTEASEAPTELENRFSAIGSSFRK